MTKAKNFNKIASLKKTSVTIILLEREKNFFKKSPIKKIDYKINLTEREKIFKKSLIKKINDKINLKGRENIVEKNIIKNIESINIMTNVCLNKNITKRNFNTFLVIEMKDNRLIYNINTGKDYSFIKNKNIAVIKGQTVILNLYKQDKKQYQSELDFYELKTIKLYKNSKLKNKYNERIVGYRVDYIEFTDINDNTFYISNNINTIYLRNNLYEIIKKKNQVVHTIYEKQTNINLDMKIFKNKTIDILKLFFDFD